MGWLLLMLAILFELAGTTTMKYSGSLTKLYPSIMMFLFYGLSLTSLTYAVKSIEVSVAYAVWSGLGTAMIAVLGVILFDEKITPIKIFSIVFIIIGVVGLKLGGNGLVK